MKTTLALHDPVFTPRQELNALDRIALRFINEARDLSFVRLTLGLSIAVIPATFYFYCAGQFSWWIAVGYWTLIYGAFLGPYTLMLHNISHRPLFKPQYRWLNAYIGWLLGPYFGQTPNTYHVHHVGMHHPENNLADDLSCTMSYQRDSFVAFLRYLIRFYTLGAFELSSYLWRRKRFKLLRRMIFGELGYLLLVAMLWWIDWQATLVLFVVPVVFSRFAMMAGNWGQHAFIDASDPANNYRNSITCINSSYNRRCFNDGYHIGHHLNQHRHWTEMPADFLQNRETYLREGAIVFEKIDFFIVWGLLMLKRYDWLAKFYVPLDDREPSPEAIEALLRERTRQIRRAAAPPAAWEGYRKSKSV